MYTQDLNSKYDIIIPSYKVFDGSLGKGLIAYYGLEDNLGSTYVTDNTKRGYGTASTNTSTLYSASGKVGGCFNFRGGANYDAIRLYNLESVRGEFISVGKPWSLSFWINQENTVAYSLLFGRSAGVINSFKLMFNNLTNQISVEIYQDGANYQGFYGATAVVNGVYSLVTLTYNGATPVNHSNGNVKLYIDSTIQVLTSRAANGTVSSGGTNNEFFIARDLIAGGTDYDGLMDQVCVWNRELTQAEITRLYNGGAGLQPIGNSYRISQQSAELITDQKNREFNAAPDWSGDNWARSGETWLHSVGATTDTTLANAKMTANTIKAGTRYLVSFTVPVYVAGCVTPKIGTAVGSPICAAGSYQQIIQANAASADLIFSPTTDLNASLDNISVAALNDVFDIGWDGTVTNNGTGNATTTPTFGNARMLVYFGVLPTASAPATPFDGAFYYDSDAAVFKIWDNVAAAWVTIAFA